MTSSALVLLTLIFLVLGRADSGVLPASTESPAPTPEVEVLQNPNFIYPNASVILNTSDEMKLKVSADAKTVADWYKDQIRDLGYNSKNFVQSKVNGEFTAEFSASNNTEEVLVKITSSSEITNIKISFEL